MSDLSLLVVLFSSIWVLWDAKSIGVKKSKGFFGCGPWGWFFCCLLLWIVAFPAYLAKRGGLKEAAKTIPPASGKVSRRNGTKR